MIAADRVVAALRFALCASAAWLCALALELVGLGDALVQTPARLGYLSELALHCSALWLPALGIAHLIRCKAAHHARLVSATAVALAAVWPSLVCAQLLSGGTGLLGSGQELPLRIVFSVALTSGYVVTWLVHLRLCAEPAPRFITRRSERARGRLRVASFALGLAVGWGFSALVDEQLRAYGFLVAFAMPAVWCFIASAFYAAMMRGPDWMTWTTLSIALVFGCAAYGASARTPALRAKAELTRRGGLVASSEAARQFAPRPRFANLSVSPASTSRCDCVEPARQPWPSALTTPLEKRRNVILISIDALRADAILGPTTPAINRFAAHGLRFSRAITPYPATLFALGGVLTGAYPSELLLAPATLPDVLQRTAASWDQRKAIWPDVVWFRESALPALITRNLAPELVVGAERQTDRMIDVLTTARSAKQRVFTWVHYYEPHLSQTGIMRGRPEATRERYGWLVQRVDQQIGRLTTALERLGYFDDSLVIIFGDHGEALGELGYYGHHVYVNQFIGDVPLLVRAPSLEPGTSDQLASLIDIAPTILEWTRAPPAAVSGDARSLFELARDSSERFSLSEAFPVRGKLLFDLMREPIASKAALDERLSLVLNGTADYQPKVALVSARERLIVNRVTGDEELYDRVADPHEQRDLSQRGASSEARLRSALRRLMRQMSERIHCRVATLSGPQR